MKAEAQKEHHWLQKLVGKWEFGVDAPDSPSEKPEGCSGTEIVRSIGGLWVVGEGAMTMPDGTPANTIITLGYDAQMKRFVGTWIGSMMTYLWVYDGELNDAGTVLTLNAEGPRMDPQGKPDGRMASYRDVIEMKSDDHRILTSHMLGDDGKWVQFMTAHYRRKK